MSNNIRELRVERDMKQEELALIAGISRSHLANIEQGNKKMTLETAKKIADALGITMPDPLGLWREDIDDEATD